MRIRNPSALPQAFGCTNLPAGIGVFPNHGFGYILPGGCVCVCVCVRERERERERESARAHTYVCVLINNLPGTCSHIHNSRWVVCVYAYKCVCANINNLSGTCSHIQNSVCVLQNASCSILSLLFTVHCGPRMVPVRHCVSAFLPSCPSFD